MATRRAARTHGIAIPTIRCATAGTARGIATTGANTARASSIATCIARRSGKVTTAGIANPVITDASRDGAEPRLIPGFGAEPHLIKVQELLHARQERRRGI